MQQRERNEKAEEKPEATAEGEEEGPNSARHLGN